MKRLSQSGSALFWQKVIRPDRESRLNGLRKLVGRAFKNRNADGWNQYGMPKADRLEIKSEARPFLRECVRWARKSRDALLAGDIEKHELLRDRARMYHAFASLAFFQRYANKYGQGLVAIAKRSASGGKGKAAEAASARFVAGLPSRDELDDLIRGYLARRAQGSRERPRVKDWAAQYGLTQAAIYRRIQRLKADSPT